MARDLSIKGLPLQTRHTFYYDLRSAFLFGIFGGFFFPFIAIVGRKIGATDFQIAAISAAPLISNAFALLWTEDVFGKGRVWYVVWPNAAGRALLIAMFFVSHPFWYTSLIFVYMLVTAIPFPSYASIMKTNYPDEFRGRLMSYVRAGIALFWILASAVGGLYLERETSNYRYLFPVAAVFGVLSALQFGHIKVRREKRVRGDLTGLKNLSVPLRDSSFARFLIAYSLFEFALLLSTPVYPLFLVDEVHISNMAAGVYGSIFSGAWLAGFFFWGYFVDRHTLSTNLTAVFLSACLIPLVYLSTNSVYVLSLAQAASGFLSASMELVGFVIITRLANERDVPKYMAAHVAFGALRGMTAPFIGVALYSITGGNAVFVSSLILGALSVFVCRRLLTEC